MALDSLGNSPGYENWIDSLIFVIAVLIAKEAESGSWSGLVQTSRSTYSKDIMKTDHDADDDLEEDPYRIR